MLFCKFCYPNRFLATKDKSKMSKEKFDTRVDNAHFASSNFTKHMKTPCHLLNVAKADKGAKVLRRTKVGSFFKVNDQVDSILMKLFRIVYKMVRKYQPMRHFQDEVDLEIENNKCSAVDKGGNMCGQSSQCTNRDCRVRVFLGCKYHSQDAAKGFLQAIAFALRDMQDHQILKSPFFGMSGDGSADVSMKEMHTMVVRYISWDTWETKVDAQFHRFSKLKSKRAVGTGRFEQDPHACEFATPHSG